MIERQLKIALVQGLAARQAAEFVKRAASYTCSVQLGKNGNYVDAKSILGVMSMSFGRGDEVILRVDGEDETAAAKALESFLTVPTE